MDPGEETQPFSDILHTIKTLIEPTIKCRDIESKDYDKVFRDAYSVIHLDESCAEKLKALIQTKNAEALVKDAVQAVKFRDEGNKYFKEEKYSEALNCYNQSLLVAPCPEHFKQKTNFEEFALSLTNRAAVLGKYKLHKNVIEDLKAAVASGYPRHLLYKALQRLAVAYKATGDEEKSLKTYQQLYKSLDDADISPEKIKKMKNECLSMIHAFPSNSPLKAKAPPKRVLRLEAHHPDIPSLSSKVNIETTETRGRFTVAVDQIRAGEVVCLEKAALLAVTPSKAGSHCLHCSQSCMTPLPCPGCCSVVFCSEDCREREMTAHFRECRLGEFVASLPARSNMFLSPVLGVVRLLFKGELGLHLTTFRAWQAGSEAAEPDQTSFTKLLRMVKHFEDRDLLQHVATCGLIMNILRCLDYIPETVTTEEQAEIFQVICHYYAALLSNIHSTSELRNSPNQQVSMSPVAIALFPDVALHINHSCDPNTFVLDLGDSQVTVASRDIWPGEEVSQVYCGHYGDTERERRRELLRQRYHFQCGCEACLQDFPLAQTCLQHCRTFAETPPSGLKTPLSESELQALDDKNEECKILVEKALMKGDVQSAVKLTLRRLDMMSSHLRQPHILFVMARMSLINYMSYLYSNKARGFKPQKLPVYF